MLINFRNTPIFYETYGKGPAIVLLHGFLESSTMWSSLISKLEENHTVVTLDFPGLGKSGVIEKIHTMEMMAEVVVSILNHLKIKSATFIGHSMGGYVTLAIAELYVDKVEKIVLLNSSSMSDSEERKKTRDRAIRVLKKNPKAFISMAIGNLAVESSREKFTEKIESLKEHAYSFPLEGITAALKGMRDRKDRTETLRNFPGPKYMILAQDDPIISVEENLQLGKEAEVGTKVISGGHMSMIENEEAVLDFIESILKIHRDSE